MRLPLPGRFGDVRETHALEAGNVLVVAFASPATRLLGRPVQPLMENPTHVIVMEFASEQALKDYTDSPAQKEWYKLYEGIREQSTTYDITN